MSYRKFNIITIDIDALKHNFHALSKLLAPKCMGIMAVVKSDAYGHGLIEVSKALVKEGAKFLGISEVEEAAQIRDAGITTPILLLSGLALGAEKDAFYYDLIPGVADLSSLNALEETARLYDVKKDVHIKVDTGMGRLGFSIDEAKDIFLKKDEWPHLNFSGLYSHLSASDDPEDPFTYNQLNKFLSFISFLKKRGLLPPIIHMANSGGVINFPETHFDIVRPGLALYGAYPGEASKEKIHLRPVMSFKSKIISIHKRAANSPVSYGHTYYTKRESKIAVVPVGYDDGYLRALSNKASVLVNGQLCPVVGRICMKALMIDITDIDGVNINDEVVLLGKQGSNEITIEMLAEWANTISYEIMCLLGTRNQRIFKGA